MPEPEPMFVAHDWTQAQTCALWFRRYIVYDAFPGEERPHAANAKTLDGYEFARIKSDGTFDVITHRIDRRAEEQLRDFIAHGHVTGPNLVRFKGDDPLPVCWDNV